MARFAESIVEDAALEWLAGLGWQVKSGPEIALTTPSESSRAPMRRRSEKATQTVLEQAEARSELWASA